MANLLGVKIDTLDKARFLKEIGSFLQKSSKPGYVVKPNAEIVTYAQKDNQFKKILNESFLSVPDGVGVLWAGRLLNLEIKDRIGDVSFMQNLLSLAQKGGWKVFFLGGASGTKKSLFARVEADFPKLKIVGFVDGYFKNSALVVSQINQSRSDIVFVGLGFPKQEKWIYENKDKLQVKLLVAEGGSFDFLSGQVQRAPVWVQKVGLEWLFRLVKQPARLPRQLHLAEFVFLVLKAKFSKN